MERLNLLKKKQEKKRSKLYGDSNINTVHTEKKK